MMLRQVGLFYLKKRRLGWDLNVTFSYLLVGYIKGRARFFLQTHRDRMRTNGHNTRHFS